MVSQHPGTSRQWLLAFAFEGRGEGHPPAGSLVPRGPEDRCLVLAVLPACPARGRAPGSGSAPAGHWLVSRSSQGRPLSLPPHSLHGGRGAATVLGLSTRGAPRSLSPPSRGCPGALLPTRQPRGPAFSPQRPESSPLAPASAAGFLQGSPSPPFPSLSFFFK